MGLGAGKSVQGYRRFDDVLGSGMPSCAARLSPLIMGNRLHYYESGALYPNLGGNFRALGALG